MQTTQSRQLPDFTPRELDVLRLLAHSYKRKSISNMLKICYKTVDSHMYSIFKKTGLHSQIDLALYAQEHLQDAGHPAPQT